MLIIIGAHHSHSPNDKSEYKPHYDSGLLLCANVLMILMNRIIVRYRHPSLGSPIRYARSLFANVGNLRAGQQTLSQHFDIAIYLGNVCL